MKTDKSIHPFGHILRELRRKKGYTQAELAKIAGVTKRVIEHYENRAQSPTLEKVKKLAAALGVADEELTGVAPLPKTVYDEKASYKIMQTVRLIESFSVREQQAVYNFINSIAEKHKLKKKAKDEDEDES